MSLRTSELKGLVALVESGTATPFSEIAEEAVALRFLVRRPDLPPDLSDATSGAAAFPSRSEYYLKPRVAHTLEAMLDGGYFSWSLLPAEFPADGDSLSGASAFSTTLAAACATPALNTAASPSVPAEGLRESMGCNGATVAVESAIAAFLLAHCCAAEDSSSGAVLVKWLTLLEPAIKALVVDLAAAQLQLERANQQLRAATAEATVSSSAAPDGSPQRLAVAGRRRQEHSRCRRAVARLKDGLALRLRLKFLILLLLLPDACKEWGDVAASSDQFADAKASVPREALSAFFLSHWSSDKRACPTPLDFMSGGMDRAEAALAALGASLVLTTILRKQLEHLGASNGLAEGFGSYATCARIVIGVPPALLLMPGGALPPCAATTSPHSSSAQGVAAGPIGALTLTGGIEESPCRNQGEFSTTRSPRLEPAPPSPLKVLLSTESLERSLRWALRSPDLRPAGDSSTPSQHSSAAPQPPTWLSPVFPTSIAAATFFVRPTDPPPLPTQPLELRQLLCTSSADVSLSVDAHASVSGGCGLLVQFDSYASRASQVMRQAARQRLLAPQAAELIGTIERLSLQELLTGAVTPTLFAAVVEKNKDVAVAVMTRLAAERSDTTSDPRRVTNLFNSLLHALLHQVELGESACHVVLRLAVAGHLTSEHLARIATLWVNVVSGAVSGAVLSGNTRLGTSPSRGASNSPVPAAASDDAKKLRLRRLVSLAFTNILMRKALVLLPETLVELTAMCTENSTVPECNQLYQAIKRTLPPPVP